MNERGKRGKNKCVNVCSIEKCMHCINLPLLLRVLTLPIIEICKFVIVIGQVIYIYIFFHMKMSIKKKWQETRAIPMVFTFIYIFYYEYHSTFSECAEVVQSSTLCSMICIHRFNFFILFSNGMLIKSKQKRKKRKRERN